MDLNLEEFIAMFKTEMEIMKALFCLGLISKHGGGNEMPEWDEQLEEEALKSKLEFNERIERIKNGIEHADQEDENSVKNYIF